MKCQYKQAVVGGRWKVKQVETVNSFNGIEGAEGEAFRSVVSWEGAAT